MAAVNVVPAYENAYVVRQMKVCDYLVVVRDFLGGGTEVPLQGNEMCDLLVSLYRDGAISPPVLMRRNDGSLKVVDGLRMTLALHSIVHGRTDSLTFDPISGVFSSRALVIGAWLDVCEVMQSSPAELAALTMRCKTSAGFDFGRVFAAIQRLRAIIDRTIMVIELNQTKDLADIRRLRVHLLSLGSSLSLARASMFLHGHSGARGQSFIRFECRIAPPGHAWLRDIHPSEAKQVMKSLAACN